MAASSPDLPPGAIRVTAVAPVNIAVIKYWGKRETKLILPVNSSLSGTLHVDSLRSRTTVTARRDLAEHQMTLNGKRVEFTSRMTNVLEKLLSRAQPLEIKADDGSSRVAVEAADWSQYKLDIVSDNNFPTAAGLASSASGLACFTRALASVFQVQGDLSEVARMGSGSACRSMDGGWVKWIVGTEDSGSDSIAKQVETESHWEDMRVLIFVVNSGQKETSSTAGMQTSVQTSDLLAHRAATIVEPRLAAMEAAIQAKDFATFAELTMKDSNQFHAVCLDTYPPIVYMNPTSHQIAAVVHELNAANGGTPIAAYTYDAGPNAVLYLPKQHVNTVLDRLLKDFGPSPEALAAGGGGGKFVLDSMNLLDAESTARTSDIVTGDREQLVKDTKALPVKYVIATKLGPGAQTLSVEHSF